MKIRFSATLKIAVGFALIILMGALLLMLPIASRDGHSIRFLEALFTATSATCVTGLVVFDTWTQFTFLGQLIILTLIQVGGLGFMTVLVLFYFFLKKRISLRERGLISESISAMQVGGVVRLTKRVLIGTAVIELSAACLLAIRFCPRFGFWQGLWYGLFHAVSAFCNAGFDLMGRVEPYCSLVPYVGDWLVNLVIMLLIITGGIGFVVWSDLWDNGLHIKRWSLHTKIMLSATFILIFGGAALFSITERSASMAGLSAGQRGWASLFQSVTSRTAGFNTVDTASLSGAGSLVTTLLMFIGAGPGSTGGGIKVTTAAVVLLTVISFGKGKSSTDAFHHRIDSDSTHRAFCGAAFAALFALTGALIILIAQNLPLRDVILEVFSALGTVGLSTGITRQLVPLSRLVIILLMYSGRVGSLTVILSVSENRSQTKTTNPIGKVIIG